MTAKVPVDEWSYLDRCLIGRRCLFKAEVRHGLEFPDRVYTGQRLCSRLGRDSMAERSFEAGSDGSCSTGRFAGDVDEFCAFAELDGHVSSVAPVVQAFHRRGKDPRRSEEQSRADQRLGQ